MQDYFLQVGGLFVSAFISATIFPGASEAVLAYLVADRQYSPIGLVTVASLGNTLGALTTWWLGSLAAKKFPIEQVLVAAKQKSITMVRHYGHWCLLFSWVPIIGDGFCFAGGWLGLSLVPACLAILMGKVIRYAVVAAFFVG